MKIKVYTFIFIQSEDELKEIAEEFKVDNVFDVDDKKLINYLKQWHQDGLSNYEYSINEYDEIDTEFLGYRTDLRCTKEGYLFSCNSNLNYIGLSYFKTIKE